MTTLPTIPTRADAPATRPQPDALTELAALLPGQVQTSDHPDWDRVRLAWTRSVDQRPAAVVTVQDAEDVVATVRWARLHGLSVSVQPVGHGATRAMDQTIMLRTGALQEVVVDAAARTARVGAGVRWGTLMTAVEPTGLVALAGSNPDPSVVGYTLGGGLSWFSRAHGLAAHSVTAFEIVDEAGEQRRITAASDPDLFWGLRGDGGGLGVVTAVEMRLYDAPPIVGGRLMWPIEMARPVLRAFTALTADAPDELTAWAHLFRFPPLPDIPEPIRGGSFVSVDLTYLGSETDANRLLSRMRQLPALVMDTVGVVPFGQLGGIAMEPVEPMPTRERSALLHELDEPTIDRLLDVVGAGRDVPMAVVQVRHLGGALARAVSEDGPTGAIEEPYQLFMLGVPVSAAVGAAIDAGLDAVMRAVGPAASARTFFNFLADVADPTSAFDDASLERLRTLKRTADPHGVFRAHRPA